MICQHCFQETEPFARWHEGLGSCGTELARRMRDLPASNQVEAVCAMLLEQLIDVRNQLLVANGRITALEKRSGGVMRVG